VGEYCSDCGQKVYPGRFTLQSLLGQGLDEALSLDRGLIHTVFALSKRPGHMVGEYLQGRTRSYTSPIKYLLVIVALTAFAFIWTGVFRLALLGSPGIAGAQLSYEQERVVSFFAQSFHVVLVLVVPFLALYSRAIFRASGLTLAEHGIFNVYVFAHQNLISLATLPLYFLLSGHLGTYLLLYIVLITLYYVWACQQFFGVGIAVAMVRASLVTALASASYVAAAGLLMLGYVLVQSGG
jgi:hypothetical protein